jgi:ceramide glucosyltransferase
LLIPVFSPVLRPVVLIYFVYSYLIFAHFNVAYLKRASPWPHSYWVTLISLLLPVQILAALLTPQRIIWRGHIMQAERGGSFQLIQRRPRND